MSGHSKWSTIKRKKSAADAKRGQVFTRITKEITVAARLGGGDPTTNPRLRSAVAAAKAANMPNENISRAIKKGTGELPGTHYEEAVYEGYGPGGVAVLVDVLTDNKNRSVADIRRIFGRYGGNLGEAGSVAWMFEKKGLILVDEGAAEEEELMALAVEAGADDLKLADGVYEVTSSVEAFEALKEAIEAKGIEPNLAEVSMVPKGTVRLEGKQAQQMLRLMESLEDHEDVQRVYANFDVPEEVMAEV